MLVLRRRIDERIFIEVEGRVIVVMVTAIDTDHQVGIGITAPADVQVWREETRRGNKNRRERNGNR